MMSDAAKPVVFTVEVKWTDWEPSFRNYLRTIPGRDRVLLNYIIWVLETPDTTLNPDFINKYVAMALLCGDAFNIDSSEVYDFLIKYVAGNTTVEVNVQLHTITSNGRLRWKSLVDHHEGVGFRSVNIFKADEVLNSLLYSGDKRLHM